MAKKAKKAMLPLLSLTLTVATLAGCSDQSFAGNSAASGTKSSTSAEDSGSAPMKAGKYDPPITITVARGIGPDVKFKNGEDINNNVTRKWEMDKFGIKFDYVWTVTDTNNAFNNKLKMMLSASEDFPDIMRVGDRQLVHDLISSGKFMSVDEAIDKYASPRLKKLWQDHPEGFYQVTKDGKRYGLPVYTQGNGSDSLLWIRTDWLNKLGLQPPKTMDDLEKIMDAFVHKDPDGNGKDDTIGLTLALKNSIGNWMGDGSAIIGGFGGKVADRQWGKDDKGNLYYGSIQPPVKKALGKLAEWYQKGYLDKEVGILDETKAVESFTKGKSGIVFGPPWMATWPFPDLFKLDPNAKVEPFPVPSGPDGIGRYGEQTVQAAILFNKNFKHIDAYMKYLDTIYGLNFGDPEWKNGFAEGYDYAIVDGKATSDDSKIPGGYVDPTKYFVGTWHAIDMPFLQYDIFKRITGGQKPANPTEDRLSHQDPLYMKGGAVITDQNQYRMTNLFYGAPTATMATKSDYLNKMENETFTKIVYGKLPVDAFDKFVEDWKKGGGDQITKEVNDWYKTSGGK